MCLGAWLEEAKTDTGGTVYATLEEHMLPCLVKTGGEEVQGCQDAAIGP